jgi:hypothetical protein
MTSTLLELFIFRVVLNIGLGGHSDGLDGPCSQLCLRTSRRSWYRHWSGREKTLRNGTTGFISMTSTLLELFIFRVVLNIGLGGHSDGLDGGHVG